MQNTPGPVPSKHCRFAEKEENESGIISANVLQKFFPLSESSVKRFFSWRGNVVNVHFSVMTTIKVFLVER